MMPDHPPHPTSWRALRSVATLVGLSLALPISAQITTQVVNPSVTMNTLSTQGTSTLVPPTQEFVLGTSCSLIDFEGFNEGDPIGTVLGTPNVTFGPTWFAVVDSDDGVGTGNFANEPSESTVATFLAGADPINFDTGVRYIEVFYSATAASLPVTLTAWDGPDGTGNIVDAQLGETVGNSQDGAPCSGDPNGTFCLWDRIILSSATDSIMSITLDGATNNEFAFDNMLFCTDVPCNTPALNSEYNGSNINPAGVLTTNQLATIGNLGFEVFVDDPTNACSLASPAVPAYVMWSRFPAQAVVPGLGCLAGAPGEVLIMPPFTLISGPSIWSPGNPASFNVPIPNNSSLCGYDCYAQALLIDGAAPGGPFIVSNGLQVLVGV